VGLPAVLCHGGNHPHTPFQGRYQVTEEVDASPCSVTHFPADRSRVFDLIIVPREYGGGLRLAVSPAGLSPRLGLDCLSLALIHSQRDS
jgi:hypothetical protein